MMHSEMRDDETISLSRTERMREDNIPRHWCSQPVCAVVSVDFTQSGWTSPRGRHIVWGASPSISALRPHRPFATSAASQSMMEIALNNRAAGVMSTPAHNVTAGDQP
jgi:hypothetical protein